MKRLITLLIAALMLLTLASCGQSGGGEAAADGSKAELALKRSVLRIRMAEKEGR